MDNTICPTCHNARDTHDRYCPQQPGAFPVAAETLTEIEQRLDGGAAPVRAASHVSGYKGGE